jgi:hypothetical protein
MEDNLKKNKNEDKNIKNLRKMTSKKRKKDDYLQKRKTTSKKEGRRPQKKYLDSSYI